MTPEKFYEVLAPTHLTVFAIVITVGLMRFKQLDRTGRFFAMFLGLMFLISLASFILAKQNIRNYFLAPGELLTEVLLVGLWFPMVLLGTTRKRIAQGLGTILLVAVLIVTIRSPQVLSDTTALLKCLFIAVCASVGISGLMSDDRIDSLSRRPDFWFFIGLLVTNAFSCFFNAFRSPLLGYSMELFTLFACLELLLQICAFALYAYVFKYLY